MHVTRPHAPLTLALVFALTTPLAACGDSGSGTTSSSTDAASSSGDAGSGSTDDGGSTDAATSSTGGSSSGTTEMPPDPAEVENCLMMVDEGDLCGECGCMNCLPELQACEDDAGCVAIRECAQENMCTGVACLEVCGDIIDMHGGIAGMSAMLGFDVSNCVDAKCDGLCNAGG